MTRDEDKLIRQLSLLSFLLSQARPFTASEVQECVEGYSEMSDDTFARRFHGDRADLAKVGIEIKSMSDPEEAASQVYFLPEDDFRLPSVEFTSAELRALAVTLAALDGRFAYARPLRLALTAITHGQLDSFADDLEQLPIALAVDEDAQLAGQQLARLEDAVTRGKTVLFSYPSGDSGSEERTLDPYSLFLIQGRWYVVGFDHAREAIRTFRLGRIRGSIRFLTEKSRDFFIPQDYDPARYRARPPWLIGPVRGTATIQVTEDLAWWVGRLAPHVVESTQSDDGLTRFSVPYADESVLLSWMTGLGRCAELLSPPELRERLRERLSAVQMAHEGVPREERPACIPGGSRPRSRPQARGKPDAIAPEHLARAIALLHYLLDEQGPRLVTWESLAGDLGLSRKEVEADLALINLVNFGGGTYALTAETDEQGVRVFPDVMAETFAHPARLSPVMARALLLALDLLGAVVALEGGKNLSSVREKVVALVGTGAQERSVIVDDLPSPDQETVDVLNHAIDQRKIVIMEYFTASRQELSKRRVEPYLLFRSRDGWYLEAYCLDAREQRTFKMERIRAASATDERFDRRPEVDLTARQTGQAFALDGAARWATVRFAPRWRSYLEDRRLEYRYDAGGWLRASIPYSDERWLAGEITRFLGDAVLEQPASTRRLVAASASRLASVYAPRDARPSIGT